MFMKPIRRKIYASAFGFVAITLASVGFSNIAIAQIVIDAPQNTPVVLGADDTVTVTSTGSITVDPSLFAIDANGFNSVITLNGPVSATDVIGATPLTTILQDGDTFNTLIVGQGGNIFAAEDGSNNDAIGVRQTTVNGLNTVELENATISVMAPNNDGLGIEQRNTNGDNIIQFGANSSIIVDTNEDALGIQQFQVGVSGNGRISLAAGTKIETDSQIISRAILQAAIGNGETTITIGSNSQIRANSDFDEASGIFQFALGGSAVLTVGSGSIVNVTASDRADGVIHGAVESDVFFGANSILNVISEDDGAFGLNQFASTGDTSTTILANSQINVRGATNAVGIVVFSTGSSSFLTLAQGGEVYASGDTAQGVDIEASNFKMQSSGRIIAHSTNANPESHGVRMVGDGNSFVNHSRVFADLAQDSHAILMDGNDNTLSLLTNPVIQGQITFGDGGGGFGTDNTLIIGSGFDAAFTVGAAPGELTVLGQGQPLVVNQIGPNLFQVLTIDQDDLLRSSSVRMSDDLVRFLQQHITTRAIQNRSFLYQDNGLIQDFWFDASGFGQHSTSGRTYAHAMGAFTIGYDRALESNALGGVYGGYSIGSVTEGNALWDSTLQTAYAGAYYDRAFDRILTGINLLGGITFDDTKRRYLDNTVPGGITTGKSNGTGFLISPEITAGYEVPYRGILVIPSVSGRYTFFHQQGYSEGGPSGLNLSALNRQQINVRLEVAGVGLRALNQGSRWSTILRGGLDVYANWGNNVDATLGGTPIPYALEDNNGGVRPFIGADAEYRLTDRATLDLGVEAAYDSIDAVFGSINAGFSVLF